MQRAPDPSEVPTSETARPRCGRARHLPGPVGSEAAGSPGVSLPTEAVVRGSEEGGDQPDDPGHREDRHGGTRDDDRTLLGPAHLLVPALRLGDVADQVATRGGVEAVVDDLADLPGLQVDPELLAERLLVDAAALRGRRGRPAATYCIWA